MTQWDPAIQRWLKKLDIEEGTAPSIDVFHQLLGRVDRHLKHLQSDREMLTRTLETSTAEMRDLNSEMKAQRDRLESVMLAAADALSVFGDIGTEQTKTEDVKAAMAQARVLFATRLSEVAGDDNMGGLGSNSIRGLRQSFTALADQITFLVEGVSEAASMREQLEVAGAVQRMLVPEEAETTFGGIELAARFEPAATCGGDWWTVHALADGKTLLVVADVTGHGVPSAIITGAAKGATDLARMATRGRLEAGTLLRMLNSVIMSASRGQYMMTAVALVIDKDQNVVMANAGHPAPLLLRGGTVSPMKSLRDPPLGSVTSHVFGETQFQLQPGDRLFVYTDGVTECVNPRDEEFSERRLRSLFGRCSGMAPTAIRDRVVEGLHQFADGTAAVDDITFVTLAKR